MRIPRRVFLDPDQNATFAIFAVALSLFVFAYSTIFGQVSILAFYGVWLPILAIAPALVFRDFMRVLPVLVLPALALLSTLWSDYPAQTLRAAIQYGSTVLCGVIAARLISIPVLTLGGVVGSLFVLVYSYLQGRHAFDVVDGSFAFAGAFSSKNQLGYFASLAIVFSIAVGLIFRATPMWRLLALGVGALAAWMLAMSDSATSLLTLLGGLAVLAGGRLLVSLGPTRRSIAIALALGAVAAGLVIAWWLGVFSGLLSLVGKDATLTGRTYLWNEGLRIGSEHPLLGLGYEAFWSWGRPEAEEFWRLFYIDARGGFHFHNTFVETFVGLGLLGTALVLGVTLALPTLAVLLLASRRSVGSAMICAALAAIFVVRSFVEVDFIYPYTVGTFLVTYLLVRMVEQRATERALMREGAAPDPQSAFARPAVSIPVRHHTR